MVEKKEKPNYGKRNRRLGHNAETYYAKQFRDLGYEHCVTARYGSRLHDDAGIDLINIPFNVQIKAGKQRGLSFSDTLKYIRDRIKLLFDSNSETNNYPNILIHRRPVEAGKRRDEYDDLVVMSFNDFCKIIKK